MISTVENHVCVAYMPCLSSGANSVFCGANLCLANCFAENGISSPDSDELVQEASTIVWHYWLG